MSLICSCICLKLCINSDSPHHTIICCYVDFSFREACARKYIHIQQPHDGKFKNPNFYGKSPIEPIIRTPERLQIKKVIDKKVAQNSKCFYNLFIKIFIHSHIKKLYHRYIHWPLAAAKPRGFLVLLVIGARPCARSGSCFIQNYQNPVLYRTIRTYI